MEINGTQKIKFERKMLCYFLQPLLDKTGHWMCIETHLPTYSNRALISNVEITVWHARSCLCTESMKRHPDINLIDIHSNNDNYCFRQIICRLNFFIERTFQLLEIFHRSKFVYMMINVLIYFCFSRLDRITRYLLIWSIDIITWGRSGFGYSPWE